jgi:hypothetical protein
MFLLYFLVGIALASYHVYGATRRANAAREARQITRFDHEGAIVSCLGIALALFVIWPVAAPIYGAYTLANRK